jgi:hypothetical protein
VCRSAQISPSATARRARRSRSRGSALEPAPLGPGAEGGQGDVVIGRAGVDQDLRFRGTGPHLHNQLRAGRIGQEPIEQDEIGKVGVKALQGFCSATRHAQHGQVGLERKPSLEPFHKERMVVHEEDLQGAGRDGVKGWSQRTRWAGSGCLGVRGFHGIHTTVTLRCSCY